MKNLNNKRMKNEADIIVVGKILGHDKHIISEVQKFNHPEGTLQQLL